MQLIKQVWHSPFARAFALALVIAAVATVLTPSLALAQDMFGDATSFAQKVVKVIGWVMVIAGLLLLVMGGFGVKEGRGGWSAMMVGVVLIFIGFKVTGGLTSASSIFG
ncbi:MAG: hypothetical protein H3C62_09460 [Gemmatimonadaceae bacterium]|nr:hypothetical protein [Gemmatimonadaceae bacterium]